MIPDIDFFLEDRIFSNRSISNVFFFHISLDKVLPETDLFFAGEMLLIFAVVNLFAIVVVVESFWRLNEAIFGKKEEEEDENDLDDEGKVGEQGRDNGDIDNGEEKHEESSKEEENEDDDGRENSKEKRD